MEDGLFKATSGMMLEARRQEAIARNLAGATIPGFKRDFIVSEEFKSALYQEGGANGTGTLQGSDNGKMVIDFSGGTLKQSGRRLDFAFDSVNKKSADEEIQNSELFFNVRLPDGSAALTKNGCFFLNSQLQLVTQEGYAVVSADGNPITLGQNDNIDNLVVTADGILKAEDRNVNPTTVNEIGRFKISRAANPQQLTRLSANYFMDSNNKASVTDAEPEHFKMMNGYYECSNASPLMEMTSMIRSYREFEMNSRIISSITDRYSKEFTKLG